ncbi:MAG: DMT family transporter [Acidimicrobiales bacterium]
MVVTIALALGAALFLAVGFVVQQRVAAREPPDERLSYRLLVKLAQRPEWLGGVAVMAVGQVLGAVALKAGNLALVEPVIATNLLFALPLAAVWSRQRLGAREWVGASLLVVGLASFVVAGDPHGGHGGYVPLTHWAMAGAVVAVLAVVLVSLSRRQAPYRQATLLASAAGVLYGLQDALTQKTMGVLGHGVLALATHWPAYALLAVAIVAMLLSQSAFEEAPLSASLPASTAIEPIAGIAFGVGLYHEYLDRSGAALALEILGIAVAVVGVYLVAASPIVSGHLSHHRHRDHHHLHRRRGDLDDGEALERSSRSG